MYLTPNLLNTVKGVKVKENAAQIRRTVFAVKPCFPGT